MSSDFTAGYKAGLKQAIDVIHAEARWQWERDMRRIACAQVVAQRMVVMEEVLKGFHDRA